MSDKLSCAVVKDLLPNYIDKLTSEETNQGIEKHLSSCEDCSKVYNDMTGKIDVETAPEVKHLSSFLKRTGVYYATLIAYALGLIAILTCLIVDLSVTHKLTWSLIVVASEVFAYSGLTVFVFCKKHRFIKGMAVYSIALLPMLKIFEWTINKFLTDNPSDWFNEYALKISIAWLLVFWLTVAVKQLTRCNIWTASGVFLLVCPIASVYTNVLSNDNTIKEQIFDEYDWIDLLAYIGMAIVCFVVGAGIHLIKKKTK